MWWLVGVVGVVVAVATYLTWVAARVDRLHQRVDAAYAALDAQLARRAVAAVALAEVDGTLGEQAGWLREVATVTLDPGGEGREITENQLTKVLRELSLGSRFPVQRTPADQAATRTAVARDDPVTAAVAELIGASRRVALARQVHTDLVRDTLAARRRPVVRMLRLDRRHRRPGYFDIEDPVLDAGPAH